MKRRDFLQLCALNVVGLSAVGLRKSNAIESAKQPSYPNVIVIMADDLGYRDFGCYGADKIPTPNCDQLAEGGMRFTDAHSPSAVCSPTRYGLLTGRYCWRSWMKNWVLMEHMPLLINPQRITLPSMLKEKGYTTGAFGKWHLGWGNKVGDYAKGILKPGPLEVGFDTFFGVPYSHNSTPHMQVFVKDRQIVGLKPGEKITSPAVQKRVKRNLKNTAIDLTSEAVKFIKTNKDRPFLLYFPTTNVHVPLTPNSRFKGKSRLGAYGDFVVEFDWTVGEVMKTLKQFNLTENTIVIVTSDNGSQQPINKGSNLPYRGAKGQIYEGGHRVPFIAHWPGKIKAGSKTHSPICLTDIMPTLADLLDIPIPQGACEDGESFLPQLASKPVITPRKPIIHHSVNGMFAIRDGKWKLIDGLGNGFTVNWGETERSGKGKPTSSKPGTFDDLYYSFPKDPEAKPGEPKGQLYDMEKDPVEQNNLWNEHPEVVAKLLQLLNEERSYNELKPKKFL